MLTFRWYIFGILITVFVFSCSDQKEGAAIDAEKEVSYADSLEEKDIVVITDPKIIREIRHHIEARKKIDAEQYKNDTRQLSLAERYNQGDTSVLDALIMLVESDDAKERSNIYSNLWASGLDMKSASGKEMRLYKAILHNLSKPEDEEQVINWVSTAEVPGYIHAFEERLFSGKSTCPDLLLSRLITNAEGCSEKAMDMVMERVRNKKLDEDELNQAFKVLMRFALNGEEALKKKAGDFAYEAYTKLLIDKRYFNEMRNTSYSENPGEYVVQIMCLFSGPECKPILWHQLKMEIKEEISLQGLVRLDREQSKDVILRYLDKPDKFDEAEWAAFDLYKINKDPQVARAVFAGYEKTVAMHKARKDDPDSDLDPDNFISTCYDNVGEQFLKEGYRTIADTLLLKQIDSSIFAELLTGYDMARDLYSFGLVEKPYEKSYIDRTWQKDTAYEYDNGRFYPLDFLENSGICTYVDLEYSYSPADYDTLITQLIANSSGKLNGLEAFTESWNYSSPYTITLLHKNKAYVGKTGKQVDDLCDIDFLIRILNRVLDEDHTKARFNRIGDEYSNWIIFCEPGKADALQKKYFRGYKVLNNPLRDP